MPSCTAASSIFEDPCPAGASAPAGRFLCLDRRIIEIYVPAVEVLAQLLDRLAEALEMHDLPRAEEADDVVHIRIVRQAQNVIIRRAGLLLGRKVLAQIADGVAHDLHRCGRPGRAGGRLRIDASRVIDEIRRKGALLLLLLRQVPRELVDDRADHLQMPELLRAQRSIGNVPKYQI